MHPSSPPAVPDVFAKVRSHERAAIMAAARAADVLPYFRTLTSPVSRRSATIAQFSSRTGLSVLA